MKQEKNQKRSLDSYITNVIEETIKSTLQRRALQEKEKQDAASSSEGSSDEEKPKSADSEKEKLKKGDVTVEDIIEKLNSIRAGKSFKDESISSAFNKYFEGLDKEEKISLLAFLKGIAQVVSGEVVPPDTMDPSEKPADIEMEKTSGPKKVSIKPNVIKAPDVEKEKKKPAEDTSGPVPITPKKK